MCIFGRVCTAGTWPAHCVCRSYLVGCVICRGVAKGSGNVDFFQHHHMNLPPPAPAPSPVPSQPAARVLLGWKDDKDQCFVPIDLCPLLRPLAA